jgi:MoxR-like ATPase
MDSITYTGHYLAKRDNPLNLDVYTASPELVEAVNLALLLEQPLLLMGEPGCGKTRLAEAVAAELHGPDYKQHYFRWDIKSTSKAKEGIYQYDALKRLYDANAQNAEAKEISNYISYGKFAQALTTPQNGNIPNVLLIDEIDKADIDFPNDLLLEIEKGEFEIPELKQKVARNSKVLIFITSNRERELPPAFLRRCLYYYINFPKQQDLIRIVQAKFGDYSNGLVEKAVHLFLDVRGKIEGQFAESEKKPATSELLEWFRVIHHYTSIQEKGQLPASIASQLEVVRNYKKDSLDNTPLPFPQILLKTWESNQLFGVK